MSYRLLYKEIVENKISSVVLENRNILKSDIKLNEKEHRLDITLSYRGYDVLISYSDLNLYDYSFLENSNTSKQLVAKFLFPFSKIPYSIYDVHNAVDDKIFDTYCSHCLYNESDVLEAIDRIIDFINRNDKLIDSIGSNSTLRDRLEESFDRSLAVASKKITREKLDGNPEKYLEKHYSSLYFYRLGEQAFINHINGGKKGELQRFFTRQSKRSKLLMYEERYLEYLYANDFNIPDERVKNRVCKQEKTSKGLDWAVRLTMLAGLITGLSVDVITDLSIENKLKESYYLFNDTELVKFTPLFLFVLGFFAVFYPIVRYVMAKKSNGKYERLGGNGKWLVPVIMSVGVIVITATAVFYHFDYQRAVGINENEVYYCQSIGDVERLSFDEFHFYLIEGDYYDEEYSDTFNDKRLVIVRGDDYENHIISDNFEYIEMPKAFVDNLPVEKSFKDYDAFCDEYCKN